MKLLLTSDGITNASIRDSLVSLLGKPVAESSALCIPTAAYALAGGAGMAWRMINGQDDTPLCGLGWKSLGVLELTALPSIGEATWVPVVREADALLVGGGDTRYLCHWMRQSGLAGLLPSLPETVYVGVSAGSTVMTPSIRADSGRWNPHEGDGLGLVDFSIFPHLDDEDLPTRSTASALQWAATLPVPGYAIDGQTAIKVTDATVDVVSEGHWKLFTR